MKQLVRDFRLLPLVLITAAALLVLKATGLLLDGGYLLGPSTSKEVNFAAAPVGEIVGSIPESRKPEPAVADTPLVTAPVVVSTRGEAGEARRPSWAQEMLNYPDITGSVGAKKEAEPAAGATGAAESKEAAPKGAANAPKSAAPPQPMPTLGMPNTRPVSPAERALLERLQERRRDLEARARELDMRETLLKATEKQLESRAKQLRQGGAPISVSGDPTGDPAGDPKAADETAERFKGLVSMYENMKAKDAARIFDRLDLKILAELASRINPRRMGDILANMSPEAAERLTIEFASRGHGSKSPTAADLPKIEGRPTPRPQPK